ncbi:hypothetical protein J3459_017055 [Metarhizium acridum]|uniref:uncharacterized protein n=1 Tax=Metarhizium acridum TaxID=92637 RepID=UPI001C6C385E|nr:hypothetical protein J3459_017055 [Metarhizium acridum]KAG8410854.1 hypothetical protein J3458_016609 [Metarhizium acridum]
MCAPWTTYLVDMSPALPTGHDGPETRDPATDDALMVPTPTAKTCSCWRKQSRGHPRRAAPLSERQTLRARCSHVISTRDLFLLLGTSQKLHYFRVQDDNDS